MTKEKKRLPIIKKSKRWRKVKNKPTPQQNRRKSITQQAKEYIKTVHAIKHTLSRKERKEFNQQKRESNEPIVVEIKEEYPVSNQIVGTHVVPEGYQIYYNPVTLIKEGRVVAMFRRGEIDTETLETMREDFYLVHKNEMGDKHQRGAAAGAKKGERQFIDSYTLGFLYDQQGYTHQVMWNYRHQEYCTKLEEHVKMLWEIHKKHFPEIAQKQMDYTVNRPQVRLAGSGFTGMDINVSVQTGVHMDKLNMPEELSMLLVLAKGIFKGGWFLIPQYKVAFCLKHGDICWMEAYNTYHGNSPFFFDKNSYRMSLIAYTGQNPVKKGQFVTIEELQQLQTEEKKKKREEIYKKREQNNLERSRNKKTNR